MSLLAPLFLAGLAALSLPLVLHLIRRTPRGRQEFSSLMFLSPSPPRLTRRSRLDQILLLLVRLAALALLAFAFARPFMRESTMLSLGDLPPRKVAILLDNSASMRRGDLWQQALAEVDRKLSALAPQDEVALLTFSDQLQTIVPFADKQDVTVNTGPEAVRKQLLDLKPTWAAGDLGQALSTLASELDTATDLEQSRDEPQIYLISDFQQGTRTDALQAYEWPARVRVSICQVDPKQSTNAHAQVLETDGDAAQDARIRVTNASNSVNDQFHVRWASAEQNKSTGEDVAIYVPPGQNRVVRLPRAETEASADRVLLRGDDQDFDNTYYQVSPPKQEVTLVYAGADAEDDTAGPQFYLRLAMASDALRQVAFKTLDGDNTGLLRDTIPPQLVVVNRAISPAVARALHDYVLAGGTVLYLASERVVAQAALNAFEDFELLEAAPRKSSSDFLLLGEIDLSHPLFAPFANPRYGDFSKIHFWRHQPLRMKSDATTKVIARFDNGDPWLLERSLGKGRLLAVTCGWQPDDSQLSVSSKFVPLVGGLLDEVCGAAQSRSGVSVNERVVLAKPLAEARTLLLPDGAETTLPAGTRNFSETRMPGIYRLGSGADALQFAVNLPMAESETAPLDLEQLKQLGVRMGEEVSPAERLDRERQARDTELESRQKIWRWLLVGCVGMLILETWIAGRASRPAVPMMRAAA